MSPKLLNGASGNWTAAWGCDFCSSDRVMTHLIKLPELLTLTYEMSCRRHPLAGEIIYTLNDYLFLFQSFMYLWQMIPLPSSLHFQDYRIDVQIFQIRCSNTPSSWTNTLTHTHSDHHPLSPHFLTLFLALPCLEPWLRTNWISSDPVDRLSEGLGYDLKRALLWGQTQPV